MQILVLSSASSGLTQRAWLELRAAGHHVVLQQAGDCRTIVIHPGPPGDRVRIGLADMALHGYLIEFEGAVMRHAADLVAAPGYSSRLAAKRPSLAASG